MNGIIKRDRKGAFEHWLNALRSGKYKQSKNSLKDSDGFCCFGVLCDLAAKDGGPKWAEDRNGDPEFFGKRGSIPVQMTAFMGLNRTGECTDESLLVRANDEFGMDFNAIADLIEKKIMPKALARSGA